MPPDRRSAASSNATRLSGLVETGGGGATATPQPYGLEPGKEPRHARMRPWTLRRIATRTLENPGRIPFGFVRRPARSTTAPVGPDLLRQTPNAAGRGRGPPHRGWW